MKGNSYYQKEVEQNGVKYNDDREQKYNEDRGHKKKKKHKSQKVSHSRSRQHHHKRHSRSRSKDHKHRKHHKEDKKHRNYDFDDIKNMDSLEDNRERERAKEREKDKEKDKDRQKDKDREKDKEKGRERDKNLKTQRMSNNYEHRQRRDRRAFLDQKDPYFQKRREIQNTRRHDKAKAEEMESELQKQILLDKKNREIQETKSKFKQAQKEMEEAKREDHTILVYCLPLKAKEKDIWNFFSKSNCGRLRDIRIIRDGRSGKSKGVAYVEFYTSESVEKALTMVTRPFELKGRTFTGLKIQHSQAEKNRTAAAARQMKVTKPIDPIQQQQQTLKRQMKVFVGGLTNKLAEIQESELKNLFEPFGNIDYVDIHRDPQTGKCKGFAFIQYSSTEDAKKAVRTLDGVEITGQKISVQTVNVIQKGEISAGDQYIHSDGNRSSLMEKLSRNAPSHSNLMRPPISTISTPYLLLINMFKMEGTTPAFFEQLKKAVLSQCSEYGIVEKCFIEKNNQGNVWVKFSDTQAAMKTHEALNGKYFDKKKIFCYFVNENTYQARVGA